MTASYDDTARLWDAATGKPIGEPMKHEGWINSAQFSPDGRQVITASKDQTARIWDAATGKPVGQPIKHDKEVTFAQFSPDGRRVVTASRDRTARLWDAVTGKQIGEPLEHAGWVNSAQFSPDGQRVLTASEDNTARLWDVPAISSQESPDDAAIGIVAQMDQLFAIDAQARAQKLTQSDRHLLRGAGVYHITALLVGGKGLNLSLLPAYLGQSFQTVSLS